MITIESSIFWLAFTSLVILASYYAFRYNSKGTVFFIWILLSFVAGFRADNVGADTYNYTELIQNPQFLSEFLKTKYIEPLFLLCNKVIYGITNNTSLVLFAYALLIYGLVIFRLWELRKNISFSVALISFYALCYFESLNTLRQYLAVAFVFFATRYLFRKQYLKFSFFVLIAVGFHKTALLGFLCFGYEFMRWRELGQKSRCFLSLLMIAGISSIPLFYNRFKASLHYFTDFHLHFGFKTVEFTFMFILSLLYLSHFKQRNPLKRGERYLLRSTQINYVLMTVLWNLGYFYPFMERMAWIFLPFSGVYFGMLMKEDRIYGKESLILRMALVVFIGYVLFNYIFLNNGPHHHPYQFVWMV